MYMNLKPNKYKRISFKTTTMTSLEFIASLPSLKFSSPSKWTFCSGPPSANYFCLKFLGPPLKLGGGTATMATPYFSKKVIHLLNVTGKILTCQKLNLISSGWNTKFFMQLKSTQYLPLPRFCQKLSCKLPSRTRPSIIKLGTNSTWLEVTHAIYMVLFYNHK